MLEMNGGRRTEEGGISENSALSGNRPVKKNSYFFLLSPGRPQDSSIYNSLSVNFSHPLHVAQVNVPWRFVDGEFGYNCTGAPKTMQETTQLGVVATILLGFCAYQTPHFF